MALKVGIVRDDRYLLHESGPDNPERPGRLKSIYRMLDKDFPSGLITITPQPVALEYLELVHTPSYIETVLRTSERAYTQLSPDTGVSFDSCLAAWLAVSGCINGLHALASGRCDVCLALVRPPGHHAHPDRAEGGCVFNNLGVTARYAMERYGFQRVLIVDWDIHHGNGLQDLFYDTDRVLYFSTHYPERPPFTGRIEETGSCAGLGYTINAPIPKEIEDNDLVYLYWKTMGAIIKRFRPDLTLVAAGFDGHHRDPVGRTLLTEKAYRYLTEMLIEFRDALRPYPILLALEGGFDHSAAGACVREILDTLTFSGRRGRIPVMTTPKGIQAYQALLPVHTPLQVWAD